MMKKRPISYAGRCRLRAEWPPMGATVEPVCDQFSTLPGDVDVILTRDPALEVLTDG